MRSVIICLLSLLFVPALGAPVGGLPSLSSHPPSTRLPSPINHATYEPRIQLAPISPTSPHPPSTPLPSIHQLPIHPPSHYPPPPHGQIVNFQANEGPHAGVIVGSHPDQQGKFKVVPVKNLGRDSAQRPMLAIPNTQVMKVHHNDLAGTRLIAPNLASHLIQTHARNPPVEKHITAPVYGSPNYAALHGSGRPGGRRRG